MKFFLLTAIIISISIGPVRSSQNDGYDDNKTDTVWYPPILGLNSTDCGLDCLMTGLRDINVLKACLDQSQIDPTTIVYREDGATYDAARQTLDGYLSAYPALVVYARNKRDVSDAVRCATEGGYRASASGGRHYTLGIIDGYVTIDTSNITEGAVIKEAKNTLTVPAGFTNGMVLHALHTKAPRNAALSVGNAGSVGYVGFTIVVVGGLGYATPMVGMACDALVEIEMVLFDGKIVKANKTHNPDILWASCGGHAGLGILTEMTVKYRLLETERFSYGRVHFSRQPTISRQAEMISQILGHFSSPSNLIFGGEAFFHRDSFQLYGMFVKSLDGVEDAMKELGFDKYVENYALDDTSSFAQASTSFVCDTLLRLSLGRPKVLQSEVLEPLSSMVGRDVATLMNEAKQYRLCNQSDVQDALLSMSETRSSSVNWSLNPAWAPAGNTSELAVPRWNGKYRFTPNLSPQDMEKLLQVLPEPVRIVRLNSGAVSEVPQDGSAFPWRNSPILMRVREDKLNDDVVGELTPDDKVVGPPSPPNGSLTNAIMGIIHNAHPGRIGSYLGLPDHATSNWQHGFYGSNYVRLARTRAKYDPLDTFGKLLAGGQQFDSETTSESEISTESKTSAASQSQVHHLWIPSSVSLMFTAIPLLLQ